MKTKKLDKMYWQIITVVLVVLSLLIVGKFTGLIVSDEYNELVLNQNFSENSIYELYMQNLTSLMISGKVYGSGSVQVYLETDNGTYLVYSSVEDIDSNSNLITGYVILDNETGSDEEPTDDEVVEESEELVGEIIEEIVEDEIVEVIEQEEVINISEPAIEEIILEESVNETNEIIDEEFINETEEVVFEEEIINESVESEINVSEEIELNLTEEIIENITVEDNETQIVLDNITVINETEVNITEANISIELNETEVITLNESINVSDNVSIVVENISVNITTNVSINTTLNVSINQTLNVSINETENSSVEVEEEIIVEELEEVVEVIENLTVEEELNVSVVLNESNTTTVNETIFEIPVSEFSNECGDACTLPVDSENYVLRIVVDNATLTLDKIIYQTKQPIFNINVQENYFVGEDLNLSYIPKYALARIYIDNDRILGDYSFEESGTYNLKVYLRHLGYEYEENFAIFVEENKTDLNVSLDYLMSLAEFVVEDDLVVELNTSDLSVELDEYYSELEVDGSYELVKEKDKLPKLEFETPKERVVKYKVKAPKAKKTLVDDIATFGFENESRNNILVYQDVAETKKPKTPNGKEGLLFAYEDTNGDSYVDRIYWLADSNDEIVLEVFNEEYEKSKLPKSKEYNYSIDYAYDKYKIKAENSNSKSKVEINGLNNISEFFDFTFIKKDGFATEIVGANSMKITNATISLEVFGDMNEIRRCSEWDFENNVCIGNWEYYTNNFIIENGTVTFTVDGFSVYAAIIEITKASHLDENRSFIDDVYEFVKAKDDNWVNIPSGDYLRVTFEQSLYNGRDITLYAKGVGSLEVYEINGEDVLMSFEIDGEKTYKKYFDSLNNSQDSFDLKIVGDVDIDWVVDPTLSQLDYNDIIADVDASELVTSAYYEIQMKWNISDIPSGMNIDDATLCIYISSCGLSCGDNDAYTWRIANQTWTETISTTDYNSQTELDQQSRTWSRITAGGYSCINVTNIIKADYDVSNTYSTMRIADPDYHMSNAEYITDSAIYFMYGSYFDDLLVGFNFVPREGTNKPYLNITYSEVAPSYSNFNVPPTNNFDNFNSTELENICNLTLSINGKGRVDWNGCVNVAGADFDSNVFFGDDWVSVDSSNLNETLNSSATITLYNIDFVNPIIYVDGELCTDCNEISYSSGTYTFSVTHFSNYSVGSSIAIESSRIYSVSNTTLDNLIGYCNATDSDGDSLNYYYKWYKNGAVFSSGSYMSSVSDPVPLGAYSDGGGEYSLADVYNLFVLDGYAYTVSYSSRALSIWNVSAHGNPIPIDSKLEVSGDYSLDGARDIFVVGDYVYTVSNNEDNIVIWNVTNKSNIIPTGAYTTSEENYSLRQATDIFVVGNIAYTLSPEDNDLVVWNVTNKSNLIPFAHFNNSENNPVLTNLEDFYISGDYAYVISGVNSTLAILNISDMSNIVSVTNYTVSSGNYSLNGVNDLFVSGDYVYTISEVEDNLVVWDVSNKSDIVPVGNYTNDGGDYSLREVSSVFVSGDYAYTVSYASSILAVFDISNHSNPVPVASHPSSYEYLDVFVSGDYVYTTSNEVLGVFNFTTGFTQGIEKNVNNISSDDLVEGDNWTLSCMGKNSEESNWLNSSTLTIEAPGDHIIFESPTTESPATVTSLDNLTIEFQYNNATDNVTSGVTLNQVLIGGSEATIIGQAGGTDIVYFYFNDYSASTWELMPSYAVDGILASKAEDRDSGTYITMNSTNYTSLSGTINSVKIRAYIELDRDGRTMTFTPKFGGSSDGDDHITPYDSAYGPGWTDLYDITTDTNAPSTWTWNDIENLDMHVVHTVGPGSNRDGLFMVHILVNYTPTIEEFAYNGQGWEANITVPSFDSGLKDLTINATYGAVTVFNTESNAINYGFNDISVTLNYPTSDSTNFFDVNFNCEATTDSRLQLKNATLYVGDSSSWNVIQNKTLTGTSDSTTFYRNLYTDLLGSDMFYDGSFTWNCLAKDNNSQTAWASSNYSFSSWDLGTYNNTEFNGTGIVLNVLGVASNELPDYANESAWINMSNNVLLLHMDESSGTIVDSSDQGNNGTESGGVTYSIDGQINDSISFDGVNDFISISDDTTLDLSDEFSISLWFNTSENYNVSVDYIQGLIDKGTYKLFLDNSDGKLKAEVINSTASWTSSYDGSNIGILSLAVYDGKLYAGQASGFDGGGDVFVYNGSSWTTSYDGDKNSIYSLAVYDGKLYAGQGISPGEGDIFVYDGSSWNLSYNGSGNIIYSLAVYDGKLYAGMVGDEKLIMYNGSSWTANYDGSSNIIYSLAVYDGKLYAGRNNGVADGGDVMVYDGSSWTMSHDGTKSAVYSLAVYDGKLYAGEGGGSDGDGDVFVYDGSSWTSSYDGAKIGIFSLVVYDGKLYAGQAGYVDGDGDVFVYDGSSWTTSYGGSKKEIKSLVVYDGKLYAGQSGGTMGVGDIFVLNAGNQISSTDISWNGYNHVAVSKNDTSLSLYINGEFVDSVNVSYNLDINSNELLIGKLYGSRGTGTGEGFFNGSIDEVAIWNRSLSTDEILEIYEIQIGIFIGNYTSQVFDAGSIKSFTNITWNSNDIDINLSVRDCDDDACSGDAWDLTCTNPSSCDLSSLDASRYIQYKAIFGTNGTSYTPVLSFVNITYQASEVQFSNFDVPPTNNFTNLNSTEKSNLCNLTLAITGIGRIDWNGCVDVTGADFDTYVDIGTYYASVDSSSLDSSLNSSANITIENIVFSQPRILVDGVMCGDCNELSYSNGNYTFNVAHFSNYSLIENISLEIFDESDALGGSTLVWESEQFKTFANYTFANGTIIDNETYNGNCNISFYNGASWSAWFEMVYNSTSTYYEYNYSFDSNGTKSWNVTCDSTYLFSNITLSDTIYIYDVLVTSLNLPINDNNTINFSNILFNCSAVTDTNLNLVNITLYIDYNGSWQAIETKTLGGTSNSTIFTRNLYGDLGVDESMFIDSGFKWNCLAYDNQNRTDWGDSNYTFSSWDLGNYNNTWFNGSGLVANFSSELPSDSVEDGWVNMTKNVLLLHMDEASGIIVDYSGQGNNGTESGGVTYSAEGQIGTALSFDGSDDYITVSDSSFLSMIPGNITFSFWVNSNKLQESDIIDCGGISRYVFWLSDTSGYKGINFGKQMAGYAQTGTQIPLNEWIHVVGVSNTSYFELYINGVLNDTESISSTAVDFSSVKIGGEYDGYFNGSIDELAIWNRSLSSDEILNIYNNQKSKYSDYISQIFDASSSKSWSNITWNSNDIEINLSVRDCDDDACSGDAWDLNCTDPSGCDLSSLNNSQYVQYKAIFEGNSTYTPILSFVNITYSDLEVSYTGFTVPPTTNFSNYNETEQLNLCGIVLAVPGMGKIEWNDCLNVFAADLDSNVDIGNGYVNVDSENLHSSFNSSANITLYNVDYLDPVIFVDGYICNDCVELSYLGGNYTFSVTHFSNYTLNENHSIFFVDPTTGSPEAVSSYDNITIRFQYNNGSENVTNGVTVNEITIGGETVNMLPAGGSSSEVYYFDDYNETTIVSNSDNLVDGSTSNYAADLTDGHYIILNSTNYSSAPDGQITSVEIRTYWGIDSSIQQLFYTPIFSGDSYGDQYVDTYNSVNPPNWSVWFDITSGTNAPSSWSWTDIEDLNLKIELNTSGGSMYLLYMVELRVNYSDQQFGYVDGAWEANVTVPDFSSGLKDLFLNASYDGWYTYNTESESVQYGYLDFFTFQINTSLVAGTNFSFQLDDAVDVYIDWNDTNVDADNDGTGLVWHEYSGDGIYNVSIAGEASRVSFYEGTEDMLIDILTNMSDGMTGINSAYMMFRDAVNIVSFTEEAWFDETSSGVTNMNNMFYNVDNFNQSLNSWNASSVTNMNSMFASAEVFDQDLNNWDTSSVTDMSGMFNGAPSFNGNISTWNTSNVDDMRYMFNMASAFNQDISGWNTINVTNMEYMFYGATNFNQSLNSWNTSSVIDMDRMFFDAESFDQDLYLWDVSGVTDLTSMFQEAISFNGNLSGWDVSNVQTIYSMFEDAISFNQDLDQWNTSNIEIMWSAF
ncbi:hypothetical protein C0585_02090 [Candidatus Woesearchaeota archaeon]|nr:MAG: hypothetical protein C0585_02090 [Candidatus Woesearchaeota archaeon]